MKPKTRYVVSAVMLVPLLGFLIFGLIVFAWPLLFAFVVVLAVSAFFSIFKRKRKAFA